MAKAATKATTKKAADKKNLSKDELLDQAIKDIEKEYGKGSIMKLGERPALDVEPIPTGSLLLNQALGIGGYPKGRIIEIYGPESSGKTTLALHAIAEVQKTGGRAAFIDAENAIDPVYAKNLGVNTDELILSQPDSGEQALNIMLMLIQSGAVDLIVVDSVAALVPQAELDGEMGDSQVGAQARMMSKAMRKLAHVMNNNNCTAIFINQLRLKVGVFYGNPETTPGGNALKFYSSVRLDIRSIEKIKSGQEMVGNRIRIKVVKNKVAPPFRTVETEIMFGKGLSAISELIDLATDTNVLKKSGSWYSYNGDKVGQGKEQAKEFLSSHPEIADEIQTKVNEILFGHNEEESAEPAAQKPAAAADDDLDLGDLDLDDADLDLPEDDEIIMTAEDLLASNAAS